MERGDGVAAVILAAEQRRELELLHLRAQVADETIELGLQVRIGLVRDELVDREGVVQAPLDGLVALDVATQARELRRQLLRASLVVP
jgi:hypothetical protein